MDCTRHMLGVTWQHHDWDRRVTATENHVSDETDQWGRANESTYVTCHAEKVCRSCGAVRDDGECGCDKARADQCAVRLAHTRAAGAPVR